jgi:hypothetical protein
MESPVKNPVENYERILWKAYAFASGEINIL